MCMVRPLQSWIHYGKYWCRWGFATAEVRSWLLCHFSSGLTKQQSILQYRPTSERASHSHSHSRLMCHLVIYACKKIQLRSIHASMLEHPLPKSLALVNYARVQCPNAAVFRQQHRNFSLDLSY